MSSSEEGGSGKKLQLFFINTVDDRKVLNARRKMDLEAKEKRRGNEKHDRACMACKQCGSRGNY